jgi:hypothetical protein
MKDVRDQHGCARMTRSGRDYIAVFGGTYSSSLIPTASIEFYDLTTRPGAWESVAGLAFTMPLQVITGSLVKQFDVDVCSAMFISTNPKAVTVCSGNYTWSSYSLSDHTSPSKLAVVDASFLAGSKI